MTEEYPDIRELAEESLVHKWDIHSSALTRGDCAFCTCFKYNNNYNCDKCNEIYPDVGIICIYICKRTDYNLLVSEFCEEFPNSYDLIIHALAELNKTGKLSAETKAQLEK